MTRSDVDPVLPRLRCRHCADVIGAYEPMVLETPHGPLQTSLAAEPGLYVSDVPCFHRVCYAEANDLDL
ncbi:MAG TPA: hypothetical protein VGG07_20865 [Solirubrobacteraceae bacterium]